VAAVLLAGCGSEPAPKDEGRPSEPTVAAIQAANDADLQELSVQIGWFYARVGRLPQSLDELRKAPRPEGWPPPRQPMRRASP